MHTYVRLALEQLGLPKLDENELDDDNYDTQIEVEYALANIEKLNVMQRCMYDIIMNNVNEVQHGLVSQCRAYFLDGPGGSSKTMLYNTVISVLKSCHLKVYSSTYTLCRHLFVIH